MKIGVITFWQGKDNYGQLLQCWALQQYLRKQGHEPFLIRYDFVGNVRRPSLKRFLKLFLIYPIFQKIASIVNQNRNEKLRHYNDIKNKERKFCDFLKDNITVSDIVYSDYSALRKTPPLAECYITGSDQVWAQKLDYEDNKAFFLAFGNKSIKRIAYAPSFAMKNYPRKLLPLLKRELVAFDSISVRESDGCKICAAIGIKATKVLDPTLLLGKTDYFQLLRKETSSQKYVYVYSLNIASANEIRWNELQSYIKRNKNHVIATPASGYIPGRELFGPIEYSYATIQDWLSNIYYAELVVTTSFHGIVFCILLEKPFIYIPLKGKYSKGNNRVLDLLEDLDLNDRILNDDSTYESIAQQSIDWRLVNLKLVKKREDSFLFLKCALQ